MPRIATVRIQWPMRGVVRATGFHDQPRATTPLARNVRTYDPRSGRARGAQRAGMTRYIDAQLAGAVQVQCLDHVVIAQAYSGSSTLGTRLIKRVAVSGGTVALFDATSFTVAAGGGGALSATAPVIFSAEMFGDVYFADGASEKFWNGAGNTVSAWTITAPGVFPSNGAHRPRLIERWNARIVMSGLFGDEHNWFMTKVGDPLDLDYSNNTPIAAASGNTSDVGELDDVINSLCPWSEEILLMGGDHSISGMFGDPAAGGSIQRISSETGMAWGRPWCFDPSGVVWFFGSRGGVYRLTPGGKPERVTAQSIDEDLAELDLSKILVRLAWDDRLQEVRVFLTRLDGEDSTHWALDTRQQGWWPDTFGSPLLNPTAVHLFDGDLPGDRKLMLGGRDGYIRFPDADATHDDGLAIDSLAALGPIRTGKPMQQIMLRELQATLDAQSGDLAYDVYGGNSVQQAIEKDQPHFSGVWYAGRNPSGLRGARGDALFLTLRSCGPWALENIEARVELLGSEAQRALMGR